MPQNNNQNPSLPIYEKKLQTVLIQETIQIKDTSLN
uniref:Uncharacterized protein n=1 Tax=Rhizophora mucronata TaxID=61149 RepID=A0A2P2N6R1_RHIMU